MSTPKQSKLELRKKTQHAWLCVGAFIIATITLGVWGAIGIATYTIHHYSK